MHHDENGCHHKGLLVACLRVAENAGFRAAVMPMLQITVGFLRRNPRRKAFHGFRSHLQKLIPSARQDMCLKPGCSLQSQFSVSNDREPKISP
ncbi:hypothetical protein AVEN_17770-1 [Araneus ventricosus]|uniref:Uncharacterized protein n=1 Tax=Araneus ventricosus TaxID=182803 RepID=A0A4Y2SFI9_ARAVE|nr:hypothetical protein AVEN_17770-1 [Araneus ventricosus]